jgi:hypothetical protein
MEQWPSHRRRWWATTALLVFVGSSSALAITALRIDGVITLLDASFAGNDAGIEEGDPFAIEISYDEALIMALGTETLIVGTDAASTFSFDIRDGDTGSPLLQQTAVDDLLGGPLLTLQDGRFESLVFQSTDFDDLGLAAFSQVEAVDTGRPYPPSGGLEILGSEDNRQLVLGTFLQVAVSPD